MKNELYPLRQGERERLSSCRLRCVFQGGARLKGLVDVFAELVRQVRPGSMKVGSEGWNRVISTASRTPNVWVFSMTYDISTQAGPTQRYITKILYDLLNTVYCNPQHEVQKMQ